MAAQGARARPRLTEAQRAAGEPATGETEAQGDCARAGPGDCGAPAPCSGGTVKGGGRRAPPPCRATSSQGALAQLAARQTALPAAARRTAPGGPGLAAQDGPRSRLRTERGPEDGGSPDRPEHDRSGAREQSDQTRPQVTRPQPTGSVARFPKPRLTAVSRNYLAAEALPSPA